MLIARVTPAGKEKKLPPRKLRLKQPKPRLQKLKDKRVNTDIFKQPLSRYIEKAAFSLRTKIGVVNFLEADKADAKPVLNLKKELVVCATLIGAIAVFSLVGLFVRLSHLETDYARIKNKTTEIFKATLPEEKNYWLGV